MKVNQIERLFSQRVLGVHGEVAGQTLLSQLSLSLLVQRNQRVTLTVEPVTLHLFDPQDQTRLF